jgi:hypothetical protein
MRHFIIKYCTNRAGPWKTEDEAERGLTFSTWFHCQYLLKKVVSLITWNIINEMQEIKVLSLYYMEHNKLNPITKCAYQYLSGLCCHRCSTRSSCN